jgi:hypothetical protein
MHAATVELLVQKAHFDPDTALAIATAIDMALQNAQLVTVAVLDARFMAFEAKMDARFAAAEANTNARFVVADAKMEAALEKFKAELVRWVFLVMLGNVAVSVAANAVLGRAMISLSQNPADIAAEAIVSKDRSYHSMLRTTCVATLLEGGHANNALPQRAVANVNCRIFPGETVESTQAALVAAIGDPGVKVSLVPPIRPVAVPPPLDPKIMSPAEKLVAKYYPGVPLIPSMSTGATDGIYLEAIGIPVYGAPGGWGDPDGNGTHGLNERRSVRSVFVGRDLLTDLLKVYAD